MENHLFPIKASNVSSNTIAIDAHHKEPQKIDQNCKVLTWCNALPVWQLRFAS